MVLRLSSMTARRTGPKHPSLSLCPSLGRGSGTIASMQDLLSLAAATAAYLVILWGLGLGVATWSVTDPHTAVAVGYARPLQRLAGAVVAVGTAVLAVVLIYRIGDAGGLAFNNPHHRHAVGALVLLPFTPIATKLAGDVAHRGDKDFFPRFPARWAAGTLLASIVAVPALVLWISFG